MNLGPLSNHKLKKFLGYNEQNEQNACHSYLAMGGIGNERDKKKNEGFVILLFLILGQPELFLKRPEKKILNSMRFSDTFF